MARQVKCKSCLGHGMNDDMIKEKEGYFHKGICHSDYLEHKEFKRRETEKLDKICRYIMELHDLVSIPSQTVVRLQELRNGTVIQAGKKVKQYKNGIQFELIYDAFLLATDSIKWCIKNKLNNDKSIKAINYGFAIMQGKLNEAYGKHQQKKQDFKRQEVEIPKILNRFEEQIGVNQRIKDTQKNTLASDENEIDITTLLDDD